MLSINFSSSFWSLFLFFFYYFLLSCLAVTVLYIFYWHVIQKLILFNWLRLVCMVLYLFFQIMIFCCNLFSCLDCIVSITVLYLFFKIIMWLQYCTSSINYCGFVQYGSISSSKEYIDLMLQSLDWTRLYLVFVGYSRSSVIPLNLLERFENILFKRDVAFCKTLFSSSVISIIGCWK